MDWIQYDQHDHVTTVYQVRMTDGIESVCAGQAVQYIKSSQSHHVPAMTHQYTERVISTTHSHALSGPSSQCKFNPVLNTDKLACIGYIVTYTFNDN